MKQVLLVNLPLFILIEIMRLLFILFISFNCFSQEVVNYKAFSIGYGEKGTQWCSYRLTHEMIEKDTVRKRVSFKKFNGIKTKDYTNTGYDRGHLAAADSFSYDLEAYNETFSLSNIAPMKPNLNRQVWKWLEVYEKRLAQTYKCIDVKISIKYGDLKVKKLYIPSYFIRKIYQCDGTLIGEYKLENL